MKIEQLKQIDRVLIIGTAEERKQVCKILDSNGYESGGVRYGKGDAISVFKTFGNYVYVSVSDHNKHPYYSDHTRITATDFITANTEQQ